MSDFEIYEEIKGLNAKNKALNTENARLSAKLEEAAIKARNDAEIIRHLSGLCMAHEKRIKAFECLMGSGVRV